MLHHDGSSSHLSDAPCSSERINCISRNSTILPENKLDNQPWLMEWDEISRPPTSDTWTQSADNVGGAQATQEHGSALCSLSNRSDTDEDSEMWNSDSLSVSATSLGSFETLSLFETAHSSHNASALSVNEREFAWDPVDDFSYPTELEFVVVTPGHEPFTTENVSAVSNLIHSMSTLSPTPASTSLITPPPSPRHVSFPTITANSVAPSVLCSIISGGLAEFNSFPELEINPPHTATEFEARWAECKFDEVLENLGRFFGL